VGVENHKKYPQPSQFGKKLAEGLESKVPGQSRGSKSDLVLNHLCEEVERRKEMEMEMEMEMEKEAVHHSH